MTSAAPPPENAPAELRRYSALRMPLLSVHSLVSTLVSALAVFVVVARNPWFPFLIPIKIVLLLGITCLWIAGVVVRLPRIETREEGLLLRGGLIWGTRLIAWHHIDSVVIWHGQLSRGSGHKDLIGVRMKRGTPKSVKFPEKERKRQRLPEPGFTTVPRELHLNSIALDWLRPEAVVALVRDADPRVHVLDQRNPLEVIDLSAKYQAPE